ncbi:uncharacterized protein FTOL_02662 [Fusarium torulosum]|uniref:SCP domain-containing protein n=1 Tax=Fusarium torulosum TaxID=33205 RepID=A0AAE8M2H5_9HYPO|nr:uncharacterized protein FTOL_02662 [Fusarium torulosum]
MQYIHVLASLAFISTVAAVPPFQCAGSVGIVPLDPDLDIGLNMINDARTDSGRTELVWDKALRDSALLRACQLAKSHRTDHHTPLGEARYLEKVATCHSPPMTHQSMAWTLQSAANSWLFVGKQNTGDPVKDAVTDWSHREQCLSPDATKIGCARTQNLTECMAFVVCHFDSNQNIDLCPEVGDEFARTHSWLTT